jgi:hypothetical protein
MGRGNEARVLEFCHDVSNGSWTEVKPGITGQRFRADGLPVTNETFNQYFEQVLRPFIGYLFDRFRTHRPAGLHHAFNSLCYFAFKLQANARVCNNPLSFGRVPGSPVARRQSSI